MTELRSFRSVPLDSPAAPRRDEAPGRVAYADLHAGLTSWLWRERETLERLLFTLVVQQLLVQAGRIRFLPAADAGVRASVDELHELEVLRSIEVRELAVRLGVPADSSLQQLSELAPEPWNQLYADHRAALRELAAEVQAATAENLRLLRAGADAARDTLAAVGAATAGYSVGSHDTSTYGATGQIVDRSVGPIVLDHRA